MDLTHQHVRWDLMEMDVLEEVSDDVLQGDVGVRVTAFLTPHQCSLKVIINN